MSLFGSPASPPSPAAAAPAAEPASASAASSAAPAAASAAPDVSPVGKVAGAAKGSTKPNQRDMHLKILLTLCEPNVGSEVHLPRFKAVLNVGFLRRQEMVFLPTKEFPGTETPTLDNFTAVPMHRWHSVGGNMSTFTCGLEKAVARWKESLELAGKEEEAEGLKLVARDKSTSSTAGQAVWLQGVRVRPVFDLDLIKATLITPKAAGPHKAKAGEQQSLLHTFPTRENFNGIYRRLAECQVFSEPRGGGGGAVRISGGSMTGTPRTASAAALSPGGEMKSSKPNPILGPIVAHNAEGWQPVTLVANCPTPWLEEVARDNMIEITIAMLYPDATQFSYYYGHSPTKIVLKYVYPAHVAQRLNYNMGRQPAVWLHEVTVPAGGGRFWLERSALDVGRGYVKINLPFATESVAPKPTLAQLPVPRGVAIDDEEADGDLPQGQVVL